MNLDALRDSAPPEVLTWWNVMGRGEARVVYCLNGGCRWVEVSHRVLHRDYCPKCGTMTYREPYAVVEEVTA